MAVQRLYSMFPTGMAGVGLFVLRMSLAAALLVDGTERWQLVTSFATLMLYVVPTAMLCLGLLTPFSAAACCLLELRALWATGEENAFHLVLTIILTAVMAMLGPGAYSIDSRLFGRRLLSVPRLDQEDDQ